MSQYKITYLTVGINEISVEANSVSDARTIFAKEHPNSATLIQHCVAVIPQSSDDIKPEIMPHSGNTIKFKNTTIDMLYSIISTSDGSTKLTPREYETFRYFIDHLDSVVTEDDIYRYAYDEPNLNSKLSKAAKTYITRIRKNLRDINSDIEIENIPRRGYICRSDQ